MRKNIKTCIYAVTAILPIVLSACSNKTDDTKIPKSTKESISTTFVEETSSDIVSTTVETTTKEDTTELISETEQEVINSTENITEQQQTQANIQQTTIITSVNPTPITTTPRPTETEQTTTPVTPEYPEYPEYEYPNPTLTIKGVNKGDKYSYNGIEFTINSIEHFFDCIDIDGYCAIEFDINISSTEFISPYCIYNIYNSNDDCIKTGNIKFSSSHIENDFMVSSGRVYTNRIPSDDFTIIIEFPNS